MKSLLILGGTRFLGRVFIEKLLEEGLPYKISLFNRGQTNADLFPEIEKINGDRESDDIEQLGKRDWDYVVDFSGYFPNAMRRLLQVLKGRVGRYIYTSTVSVYDLKQAPIDTLVTEAIPRLICSPEMREHKTDFAYYGQQKAACETELEAADWLEKLIFRPSVVFGKYDYTDRHYYWLLRAKMQDEIIVPKGIPSGNYTFVEDYAELVLKAMRRPIGNRIHYNATTHATHNFNELVQFAADYWQREPEILEVAPKILFEKGICGGRNNISLWFQGPLMFDNQAALDDFSPKYQEAKPALYKTIEYYNSIYGDNWQDGSYGWTMAEEKEMIRLLGEV